MPSTLSARLQFFLPFPFTPYTIVTTLGFPSAPYTLARIPPSNLTSTTITITIPTFSTLTRTSPTPLILNALPLATLHPTLTPYTPRPLRGPTPRLACRQLPPPVECWEGRGGGGGTFPLNGHRDE